MCCLKRFHSIKLNPQWHRIVVDSKWGTDWKTMAITKPFAHRNKPPFCASNQSREKNHVFLLRFVIVATFFFTSFSIFHIAFINIVDLLIYSKLCLLLGNLNFRISSSGSSSHTPEKQTHDQSVLLCVINFFVKFFMLSSEKRLTKSDSLKCEEIIFRFHVSAFSTRF